MASVETAKSMLAKYSKASEDEKVTILSEAETVLTKTQLKAFKKQVEELETDSDDDDDGVTPAPSSKEVKGKVVVPSAEVTEADLEKFWEELDVLDLKTLLDDQVIKDFQYVGFNPDTILRSVIALGRAAKRDSAGIKKDIANMCTIAVIKGSVTDNNLKKMSDEGKRTYSTLEERYKLKRGGSKGMDPTVVTVARVGAAFPGSIMRILVNKPDLAKKFAGPFGTKALPPYLRHQSAAACIPETLDEPTKSFLLGLITAFTADQSKVISRSKDKPDELFDRQENFVTQTYSSNHPTEEVRKSIFKQWTLDADYAKLKLVADNITKIRADFSVITQPALKAAISKL
jgi:hypothetical protein